VAAEAKLPAEVTAQPARALYAGDGGSALVVRLLADVPARLSPGGKVLAEIDPTIASAVSDVAGRCFAGWRIHRDTGGRERVLEAWS